MRVARVTNGAFCARSAQSGTDRGAAARFRQTPTARAETRRQFSPTHLRLYTHLSVSPSRARAAPRMRRRAQSHSHVRGVTKGRERYGTTKRSTVTNNTNINGRWGAY